jgi:hypothetical protein
MTSAIAQSSKQQGTTGRNRALPQAPKASPVGSGELVFGQLGLTDTTKVFRDIYSKTHGVLKINLKET